VSGGTVSNFNGFGGAIQINVDNLSDSYDIRCYITGSNSVTASYAGYSNFSAVRVGAA